MNDTYSDEQLVAYLDHELDAATARTLTKDIATSTALAERLKRLDVDRLLIKRAFDAELLNAPKIPARAKTARSASSHWSSRRTTAFASIAAVVGFLGGTWLNVPEAMSWQQQAASYHALYSIETLAAVQAEPIAARRELERVSAAIGKELNFEKLSRTPGLTYKRAQVLRFERSPLAQLAFVTPDGTPVALCIMPDGKVAQSMQSEVISKLHTVSWSAAGFSYLLVGGHDPARLQEIAVSLQKDVG